MMARETIMNKTRIVLAAATLALSVTDAVAHCDAVDGPVAKAAEKALTTGNVYLVLPYAPASAERELQAAFALARKVRGLSADARQLADRAFMETAVRLHREGEGAPYTGLKASGDHGPVIPAAEAAIASGKADALSALLAADVEHALGEKLRDVRELRAAPAEAKTASDVVAARRRISAELEFVAYAEGVRQAVAGALPGHHAE
jgi:hypothetical protein